MVLEILLEKNNKIQSEINKKLSVFEKKNEIESLYFLIKDLCLTIFSFSIFYYFIGINNNIFQYVFYSMVQGTIMMSLWVLSHECGHYSFSNIKIINNIIGYIFHTFLLVPYFAWQYSHKKHHKYTNHLTLGETHVPKLYEENKIIQLLSEDIYVIYNVIRYLLFGWVGYLLVNKTGGRTKYDLETPIDSKKNKSHFLINSQVFPPYMNKYLVIDSIGILGVIVFIIYNNLVTYYIGPYLIVNCWLVLYTWMHHTNHDNPHYGTDEFTFLRGALSTIDRKYPEFINNLHHDIGFTHVLHHINSKIPHYKSREALNEIMPIIKDYYRKDEENIITSLLKISKTCHYVDNINGIQYYKSFYNKKME
jgi:fatty acid desaturase